MSARIQLESYFHPERSFVTLTYNDDHLPVTGETDYDGMSLDRPIPTLVPEHLDGFIKKLRNKLRFYNSTFRYFAVGEYGDQGELLHGQGRPHYHLILFGIGPMWETFIQDEVWEQGFVESAELTPDRCSYVAGYTVKKWTKENTERLRGRYPEFTRASRNPGIGATAIPWLASEMAKPKGMAAIARYGDVFSTVRIGGKVWPLSNYLRRKLRDRLGLPQDFRKRDQVIDWIDRDTGELIKFQRQLEPDPLPTDYSPAEDISAYPTPWRRHATQEIKQETQPEILRRAAKSERRGRSQTLTQRRL